MKGLVKIEVINTKNICTGTVAVLNDKNSFEIVTVQHINKNGNWVVMGDRPDSFEITDAPLCRLVVESSSKTYPLKYNQWSNAIRNNEINSGKEVDFELIPIKFKEGKHVTVCDICTAHFLGSRSQYICKTCCNENVTAKILINKSVKQESLQTITVCKAQELIILAYNLGKTGTSSEKFDNWLKNNTPCQ